MAPAPVPESLLKKRQRDDAWRASRAASNAEASLKAKASRKTIFKKAEAYVKEYRQQVRLPSCSAPRIRAPCAPGAMPWRCLTSRAGAGCSVLPRRSVGIADGASLLAGEHCSPRAFSEGRLASGCTLRVGSRSCSLGGWPGGAAAASLGVATFSSLCKAVPCAAVTPRVQPVRKRCAAHIQRALSSMSRGAALRAAAYAAVTVYS